MNRGLFYDETLAVEQERVARSPDMVAQRQRMHAALELRPGERVLEIGSGNGIMCSEMAVSVAPQGSVTGADISPVMVAMARVQCADFANVELVEADAAKLPFPDAGFDVVTCTQCLCLVSDIEGAVGEMWRVLKRGGRAVMLETDWDTLVWNSSDPALMDRIMGIYKAAYVDARIPRRLSKLLTGAGFEIRERNQFVMLNWVFEPDTFSGHQIGFTRAMAENDRLFSDGGFEAWVKSIQAVADAGEYFFSLNRYIFSAVKANPVSGEYYPTRPMPGTSRDDAAS